MNSEIVSGASDSLARILNALRSVKSDDDLTEKDGEISVAGPFGGFHTNVLAGAKIQAFDIRETLDKLEWNPFDVVSAQ